MNYLKPRELVTPQQRALGGAPRLPYESYIESMSQHLPGIREAEREQEYIRQMEELAEERRKAEIREGKTSLFATGAGVGERAKPLLEKYAKEKTTGILGAKVAGTAAKYLSPATFGATAGSVYGGLAEEHEWGKKLPGGEEEWKVAGGALTGAATGFVAGGFTPVGALVGALSGAGGAKCIIVTACTNPQSYEVNIARLYRDKFMNKIDLRGYYWLAERVVNTIKKHSFITWLTKHILVDKLIDYGEWKLGRKKQKPKLLSTIITKLFLKLCRIMGRIIPTVVRNNGEVF